MLEISYRWKGTYEIIKKKELSDCREGKSETNFSQREFFSTQNFELCSHITYMKIK